ncbi:MAG: hypothetical protein HIU91_16440 [Acidobacteria bacterium]|nr:hypothetical protein [Acidobacteriota bacterium]
MLDVHPPHEAAHTWKDFFIHIATIVVGLLIAVGLEQTVEFFHHRHQLREVRAQLEEERDTDSPILQYDKQMSRQMKAELAANIALLDQHMAGDKTPLAGKLHYKWLLRAPRDGAWQSAKQSAAISLMDQSELAAYSYRYFDLASYTQSALVFFSTMDEAAAIVHDTPSGEFSADDLRDLIRLTHQAQGQLSLSEKYLELSITYGLSTETRSAIPIQSLDQLPD